MNKHYKLPVIKIFFEALSLPGKYFTTLLRLGTPLLIVGTSLIIYTTKSANMRDPDLVVLGVVLLFLATLVMAIIGCHRTFLMSTEDVLSTKAFRWTGREMRFVGWWALIGLCSSLISIPLMLFLIPFVTAIVKSMFASQYVAAFAVWLINISIYYVISRWSMLLPATAIDIRHKSLEWAWNLSSGNGWRLTFLIVILPQVTSILASFLPTNDSLFYLLFLGAAWLIVGVIEIGLISLSYAYLAKNNIASTQ